MAATLASVGVRTTSICRPPDVTSSTLLAVRARCSGGSLRRYGPIRSTAMSIVVVSHPSSLEHLVGVDHPEHAGRLGAVREGLHRYDLMDALTLVEAGEATTQQMARVHSDEHIELLSGLSGRRVHVDADTSMTERSWEAAAHAAGAGITALDHLSDADGVLCLVRPPGHHATRTQAMGFCLINSAAVVAAELAARGERVLIVDVDAHHGNGTQDIFWSSDDVMFVSFHQWPLYPGTGRLTEMGEGVGFGTTMNLPVPPGATGDLYLALIDSVVAQQALRFGPTALVISAGFDAHRRDPITDLALSSGDYQLIVHRIMELVPAATPIMFLEGGYDLDAVRDSSAAALSAMLDMQLHPEAPSSGGPRQDLIARATSQWSKLDGYRI
jgi:acetoin utilization deacetylase AcuC-like enzyme